MNILVVGKKNGGIDIADTRNKKIIYGSDLKVSHSSAVYSLHYSSQDNLLLCCYRKEVALFRFSGYNKKPTMLKLFFVGCSFLQCILWKSQGLKLYLAGKDILSCYEMKKSVFN